MADATAAGQNSAAPRVSARTVAAAAILIVLPLHSGPPWAVLPGSPASSRSRGLPLAHRAAGWSAIMEVLGRSGISVTMNIYAHMLPRLRQDAADAIDELSGE
jgi:hypothetical protein